MKDNADKYLNDLTKKVFKEASIETPSFNFNEAVMSQVKVLSKSNVTVYKPLISKITWTLILVGFLAITIYVLFYGNQTDSVSWLSKLDFSFFSNNSVLNTLSSLKLSKTLTYAVVFFGLMFCIQIPFLKHHFNQRFEN